MAQLQRVAVSPEQVQNQQILLTPEQQHYLLRVLRLKMGDRFIALDGLGNGWLSQLAAEKTAQILEPVTVDTELPIPVTLIAALPKNGFDEVVRSCTELGVSAIIPLLSDRTILKPSPQKLERWRRIAQEAAEQSERQIVPTLYEPISWPEVIENLSQNSSHSLRLIGVTRQDATPLFSRLQDSTIPNLEIAIGPEGGWTDTEVETALSAGFKPITLGKRILRAVTAPVAAISVIAASLESLNS